MDEIDIQNAISRRIRDIADRPALLYPNDGGDFPLPRWTMQLGASAARGRGINRPRVETDAEVMVLVETASGDFTGEAGLLVKKLLAAFPLHVKFEGVQIMTPPKVQAPYPTGVSYAVPVIIRGRAH